MTANKVTCALLFAFTISKSVLADAPIENNGKEKVLHQVPNQALVAEKGKITDVRYEVCADVGGIIYYCPGDEICCTPGSPESKCCPEDHPLCLGDFCCPIGYPKLCGRYCCKPDSFCCNGGYCCKNEQACCDGEMCCTEEAPCCKYGATETCCNKDTKGCCDGYGCADPCESQFDAIGCQLATLNLNAKPEQEKELNLTGNGLCRFGKTLFRILRPTENPVKGLVAKNPHAKKTVLSHVNCGSKPKYESQYISSTASLNVAKYYKEVGEKKGLSGLRIAEIELDKLPTHCKLEIVDLTTESNRNKYLGNAVCKNFAKKSCEVLLVCDEPIPCKVISEKTRIDFSEL